ncbi:protein MOR1 [Tanacetum coccineum]
MRLKSASLLSFCVENALKAVSFAKGVCDAVVAKCLTGRPKTIEKAQMVFMLWVELEAVDVVLDAMEKAIKHKVAKAVVLAIDVMFQALSEFGSKIVAPQRLLKMLPELFDHQNQNVRASSIGLTLELCRWIGRYRVKSMFEEMRDKTKKELVAELANVTGSAKPTHKIRNVNTNYYKYLVLFLSDLNKTRNQNKEVETEAAGSGPSAKKAIAELTKLASTKRIAPGDFSDICRTLKKLITDENIAVGVEAVQAIGNLDIKAAVKNKVPLEHSLTLNWVSHCIEKSNKAVILKCLNDRTPDVMDAAFSVLAAIAKSVGLRPLKKSLEKLDDVRQKKLLKMIGVSGRGAPTMTGSAVTSVGGAASSAQLCEKAAPIRTDEAGSSCAPSEEKDETPLILPNESATFILPVL